MPENQIQAMKQLIQSPDSDFIKFERFWEKYPEQLRRKFFPELVAKACQNSRCDILTIILDDQSLLDLLDMQFSIGSVNLTPLQYAFFYGQIKCVKYLKKNFPEVMNVESLQITIQGLVHNRDPKKNLIQQFFPELLDKKMIPFQDIIRLLWDEIGTLAEAIIHIPVSFQEQESEYSLIAGIIQTLPPTSSCAFTLDEEGKKGFYVIQNSSISQKKCYTINLPQDWLRCMGTPFEAFATWYLQKHVPETIIPAVAPRPVVLPMVTERITLRILNFKLVLLLFNQNNLKQLEEKIDLVENEKLIIQTNENDEKKLANLFLETWKLGQWVIKNNGKISGIYANRDAVLQDKSSENTQKLKLIERFFHHLYPELFQAIAKNQRLNPLQVESWYLEQVTIAGSHFAHDLSDDSDSEDESSFPETKRRKFAEIKELHSSIWAKTRRENLTKHKKKEAKVLEQVLKAELKKRATLDSSDATKPQYVAAFRGVNYLADRWTNQRKRQHYQLDEVGKTHYSEAALMAGGNFYQSMDETHLVEVEATARKIQEANIVFGQTNPCIGLTTKPSHKFFIFNSLREYLQHYYSNGISDHLKQLVAFLKVKDSWLSQQFSNAYNYAISTGDRPYHSLRYALGLKDYYHNSFKPCYNQDGSIDNFHAGKLYIFLFTLDQMKQPDFTNRVNSMLQKGCCPIGHHISSEVETTFFGKIEAEQVVYQFELRFPSFHKPYQKNYEVKYGLDPELYHLFQTLFQKTPLSYDENGVSTHAPIITLLKEWLCAYYEVVAIKTAQRITQSKGGNLTYYNELDKLSTAPTQRPLIAGEKHIEARRQTHVLEVTRRYIASKIIKTHPQEKNEIQFIGHDLPKQVKAIIKSNSEIKKIIELLGEKRLPLTSEEQASIALDIAESLSQNPKEELYADIVKKILQDSVQTFSSKPKNPMNKARFFSWEPQQEPSFQNTADLAEQYCSQETGSQDLEEKSWEV